MPGPRWSPRNGDGAPTSTTAVWVAVLSSGPVHGYAIVGAPGERSKGAFDVAEGSIYPALHQLEAAGIVSSSWQQVQRRRCRVYQLTPLGCDELLARHEGWRGFSAGDRG